MDTLASRFTYGLSIVPLTVAVTTVLVVWFWNSLDKSTFLEGKMFDYFRHPFVRLVLVLVLFHDHVLVVANFVFHSIGGIS